jgi:hypothetical protein
MTTSCTLDRLLKSRVDASAVRKAVISAALMKARGPPCLSSSVKDPLGDVLADAVADAAVDAAVDAAADAAVVPLAPLIEPDCGVVVAG